MPKKKKTAVTNKIKNKQKIPEDSDAELKNYKKLKAETKPKIFKLGSEKDNKKSRKKRIDELTVEEIKAEWKKYDEMKKKNQELFKLAREFEAQLREDEKKEKEYEKKQKEKEEKAKKFVVKDCKHMTNEELRKKFESDVKWVDSIFTGARACERHQLFQKDTPQNRLTSRDLMYNVSCEVFSEEQQILLVSLFRERYDAGNMWQHCDYYWKVLLPEYCLKIFMDTYLLSRRKAMDYLNSIPVPIHRYFKLNNDTTHV